MKHSRVSLKILLPLLIILLTPKTAAAEAPFFKDDFSKDTIKKWEIIDEGTKSAPSKWNITKGEMVQSSNIYGAGKPAYLGTMALAGKTGWKNYLFEADVSSTDNDMLGLIFYYRDKNNYYRLRLLGDDKNYKDGKILEKVENGIWTILAKDGSPYEDARKHKIRITILNARIQVYYDDMQNPLFDFDDKGSTLMGGKIGLYSWGNKKSFFDNLLVQSGMVRNELQTANRIIPPGREIPINLSLYNLTDRKQRMSLKTSPNLTLSKAPRTITLEAAKRKEITFMVQGKSEGPGKVTLLDEKDSRLTELTIYISEKSHYIPLFGDFHMHTTYSDGKNTPAEMVIQSKRAGQDVIAISDHGTTKGAEAGRRFVNMYNSRMLILRSEENPGDFPNTHLLAFQMPDGMNHLKSDAPKTVNGTVEQLLLWAQKEGILIFQAHPVWSGHKGTREEKLAFTRKILDGGYVTGIEVINHSPDSKINEGMAEFYQKELPRHEILPITGGSDAHSTKALGKVRTLLFVKNYTEGAVLEALKEGRTVVMNADGSYLLGPEEYIPLAEIIVQDFLPAHDQLAAREGQALYLYWGGHVEMKQKLKKIAEEWDNLYNRAFPYTNKN